ncbi:SGNH hydrolase domain-containing protein [Pseudomonas sp. CCI1.1]|uniref:SGNH hydrolase domain-containing protein n=1 Tax=Pseudomonas sp. CCI1.1 TaxID=3048613 RepID=UPI0034DDBF46
MRLFYEFRQGCYLSTNYTKIENGAIATPCLDHYQQVLNTIKSDRKPLIYASAWTVYRNMLGDKNSKYIELKDDNAYIDFIIKNLGEFRQEIGDRPLIIVGVQPYTNSSHSAASCLLRPRFISQPCDLSFNFDPKESPAFEINKRLRIFAESTKGTLYIDPSDSLCPDGTCRKFQDGDLMYSDLVHLSIAGSMRVSKQIVPALIEAIKMK